MAPSRRFLQPINLSNISSDPVSSSSGDLYFNSASSTVRYFDGTEWKNVGAGSAAGVTVSETAPVDPQEGQGWFKSSTSELFFWDGTFWVEATSVIDNYLLFTISASAPSDPQEGAGWFDNVDGDFYIYDGTYWQQVVNTVQVDLDQDTSPSLSASLDANNFGIENVDHIDFSASPTAGIAEGRLLWDDGEGTLQLGLKGGNVNLSLGQEVIVLCYNGSGSALSDGDVVYVQGAQGQKPDITLASASSEAGSSKTLGIVTEPIASGAEGFVTTFGIVNNVNTLGFTEGSALWLDTTAGAYTETKPTSPDHLVFIGYCLKANETAGRIFVSPQNGYELEELHDVLITSVQDADIISYDSANGLWKNIPVPVSLPDQTGHDGEYLTTNGASASWSPIEESISPFFLGGM